MPDQTFFNQSVSSPTPVMNVENKSNGGILGKILITVLVLVILGEAGYFFYNRYVSSGGKLPFQNLSTSGTMDQSTQSPSPELSGPVNNPSLVSHVGNPNRDKADETIQGIFSYPAGFVIKSSVNITLEGKVVSLITDAIDLNSSIFSNGIRLVNVKGEPLGVRFSDEEMKRMRVIVVNKGVIEREATYQDIKPGDMLNIIASTDLMDLRRGIDDITIEIRKY